VLLEPTKVDYVTTISKVIDLKYNLEEKKMTNKEYLILTEANESKETLEKRGRYASGR